MRIDGLQYANWSEKIFRQLREGGLDATHVTIAYHESFRETVLNFEKWNRWLEQFPDLIMKGQWASDIDIARETGRTAVFFGFQNSSPIEDDIGLEVDMSHSADRSTIEAAEFSERPIAITHANPYDWSPALRNKKDPVIQAVVDNGGMLGFSVYPHHLKDKSNCTLHSFCEMIARAADTYGVQNLAIGSDLCQDQPDSIVEWMRTGRWTKEIDTLSR
ncbi:dipeptidase [Epibacterium ulvae]|nr:dipeptidase [Epibacterium ulvae]